MEYTNKGIREANKPSPISNMELFNKTKSFIENIKGVSIRVRIGTFPYSFVEWEGGNKFIIGIKDPPDFAVPQDIAFYHETSHIVFDSLVGHAHRIASEWASQFDGDYKGFAEHMWLAAFNILEDTRIESQWGKIYAGTNKKFINTRKRVGQSLPNISFNNPIYSLQGARVFRDDLIFKGHEIAKQYMEDVANTSLDGSIILANRYCELLLKPYINEKIKRDKEEAENITKSQIERINSLKMPDYESVPQMVRYPKNEELDKMNEADRIKAMNEFKQKRDEIVSIKNRNNEKQNEFTNQLQQIKNESWNELNDKRTKMKDKLKDEIKNTTQKMDNHNGYLEADKRENKNEISINMNASVDSLKKSGGEEAKMVIAKINKNNMEKTNGNADLEEVSGQKINNITRPLGEIHENPTITKWIEKTFKSIANKPKERIVDFGDSVSIPHLIRSKAKGFGAFYKSIRKQRSIAVLLMVDGSGSMREVTEFMDERGVRLTRFDVMRDLTASIFDPLDNIKHIDFKACVWSGNFSGELCITNIEKKSDVMQISKSTAHLTPTHLALAYSGKMVGRMKGKDKYIIMMTDGTPEHQGFELGDSVNKEQLVRAAQKECKILKGRGNKVLGIFLGNQGQELMMKKIFGSDYVRCNTMEEVQTATLKKMKRILVGR